MVVLIAAIFAVIMLSVHRTTPKVPEVLSDRGVEYDIEYLASYSLNQAIKKIPNSVDDDTLQVFTNYEVIAGGYIDTLSFDFDYHGDSTKAYIYTSVHMITPEQDTVYGEGEAEIKLLYATTIVDSGAFDISGGEVIVLEPVDAQITVIGCEMAGIPITMKVNVGDEEIEPFGDYDDHNAGNVDDGNNPRYYTIPYSLEAETAISITGRSWRFKLWGWKWVTRLEIHSSHSNCFVLRNGDEVPPYEGWGRQADAKEIVQDYIDDETGLIVLEPNQTIFLFELFTTNTSSSTFDIQDLVVMVSLALPGTLVDDGGGDDDDEGGGSPPVLYGVDKILNWAVGRILK